MFAFFCLICLPDNPETIGQALLMALKDPDRKWVEKIKTQNRHGSEEEFYSLQSGKVEITHWLVGGSVCVLVNGKFVHSKIEKKEYDAIKEIVIPKMKRFVDERNKKITDEVIRDILMLVITQCPTLEEKRVAAILNPPKEYRLTYSGDRADFEPQGKYVAIFDNSKAIKQDAKTIEVGRSNKRKIVLVDKNDLLVGKLKSAEMMPVYIYKEAAMMIVISKTFTVCVTKKDDIEKIADLGKKMKFEVVSKEDYKTYFYVRLQFTDECSFLTVQEASRYFGDLKYVKWSQSDIYGQIRR